jgi:hypothetical protein
VVPDRLRRHADPTEGAPEGDHGAPWPFVDQGHSRHLRHLFPALDEALTEGLDEQFQNAISNDARPARGLSELPLSA